MRTWTLLPVFLPFLVGVATAALPLSTTACACTPDPPTTFSGTASYAGVSADDGGAPISGGIASIAVGMDFQPETSNGTDLCPHSDDFTVQVGDACPLAVTFTSYNRDSRSGEFLAASATIAAGQTCSLPAGPGGVDVSLSVQGGELQFTPGALQVDLTAASGGSSASFHFTGSDGT